MKTNANKISFRVDKDLKEDKMFYGQKSSKEMQEALQEVRNIENGKKNVKGYNNVNAFIEDILK